MKRKLTAKQKEAHRKYMVIWRKKESKRIAALERFASKGWHELTLRDQQILMETHMGK